MTPSIAREFTLVIAEDGSDSSEIANKLMEYSNIVYFQHDKRQGRGKSLREAWKKVGGAVYPFMDVNLAIDLMGQLTPIGIQASHPPANGGCKSMEYGGS